MIFVIPLERIWYKNHTKIVFCSPIKDGLSKLMGGFTQIKKKLKLK